MAGDASAAAFLTRLHEHQSDAELAKYGRYFKTGPGEYAEGDVFLGVRMGTVFAIAKEFTAMPLGEIEALLDADLHEARAGAVRIMAQQAASKHAADAHREALYELYLRRHDRIDNWDLVDLGAWSVVGSWLLDRPRDVLFRLAGSENLWERRTAMLATLAFVRRGQLDDAYAIAEVLLGDDEDLVRKPVGAVLRTAGDHDRDRLLAFLDAHAAAMPRVALRFAMEHLDEPTRKRYLSLGG